MRIQFCGAARAVTGSCHLLECDGGTFLIDCGMRQGEDTRGEYGEDRFPFEPAKIDAVFLTHAHIDHSGLIPLLVKQGFKGVVLSTQATAELATIMLPDSAHIQEQEAEWTNRKNQRAGKPLIEPLYTMRHALDALTLFHAANYAEIIEFRPDVKVRFNDAGHLLGSASLEIWVEEKGASTKLVFSGDIGRNNRPIINDPTPVHGADYVIMEGTYGDRNHEIESEDAKEKTLANVLRAGIARGGNIVIPSFAVGRTQELLYYIKRLLKHNRVPGLEKIPVYIDSPLGIEATKVYERCAQGYYDQEALEMAKSGSPFDFPTLRIAKTADESRQINFERGGSIIISSSGMCDAGRIRHHLKHNLYRADSTIFFAGYQAIGTLGRSLVDGVKQVKLFGEQIRVNATIEQIDGFSGHAGRDELIEWIRDIGGNIKRVFLVHGEEKALESLENAISSLGFTVEIPAFAEEYELTADAELAAHAALHKAAVTLDDLKRGAGIRREAGRILALLDAVDNRRSPDMGLKLDIMEADVKALVEKWGGLLSVQI